jgi:peptidoglycan/xylan/chitin deacetylase (PgdA/CDA1 family)
VIAITVDDCFDSDAVRADLAIFERYQVNATWFPVGWEAAKNPSLWREVDAAGFPIANHTYDHEDLTLKTYAQAYSDIRQDNDTLSWIIGHPIMPFVRPPGGDYNATVLSAAAAAGERAVVDWDMSDGDTSGDWTNVPRLISLGEQGRNGSIILMHANGEYTTAALPAIIAYYRARGFSFVTLGQLLGVPGPVPFGPVGPSPSASESPSPLESPSASESPSAAASSSPSPSSSASASSSASPSAAASPDQAATSAPAIPSDVFWTQPEMIVAEPPWA